MDETQIEKYWTAFFALPDLDIPMPDFDEDVLMQDIWTPKVPIQDVLMSNGTQDFDVQDSDMMDFDTFCHIATAHIEAASRGFLKDNVYRRTFLKVLSDNKHILALSEQTEFFFCKAFQFCVRKLHGKGIYVDYPDKGRRELCVKYNFLYSEWPGEL